MAKTYRCILLGFLNNFEKAELGAVMRYGSAKQNLSRRTGLEWGHFCSDLGSDGVCSARASARGWSSPSFLYTASFYCHRSFRQEFIYVLKPALWRAFTSVFCIASIIINLPDLADHRIFSNKPHGGV